MTTLQIPSQSRLPMPNGKEHLVVRPVHRRALGDITSSRVNVVKSVALNGKPGDAKRITRQASRRLAVPAPEPMEVEQEDESSSSTAVCLPHGVEDIDAKDIENPQLCAEYALEMFAYLKQLEVRGAVRPQHLAGCPTNDKMRAVLVDWLVEVQIQFKLLQETLFSTVNIVDRFLAVEGSTVTRSRLQLIGVSAMFLAAKVEEVYAPACSDFVYITDNAYTELEIRQTELRILRAIKFDLFQPISLHFLRRYSKAGDVDVLQHSLAKYALEVALLEYNMVSTPSSQLAAAALFLSLLVLEPEATQATVWSSTLAFYSGYNRDQLLPTAARMANAIQKLNLRGSKLQAVKIKYKAGKFLKVSELPDLKGEVMTKLANMKV